MNLGMIAIGSRTSGLLTRLTGMWVAGIALAAAAYAGHVVLGLGGPALEAAFSDGVYHAVVLGPGADRPLALQGHRSPRRAADRPGAALVGAGRSLLHDLLLRHGRPTEPLSGRRAVPPLLPAHVRRAGPARAGTRARRDRRAVAGRPDRRARARSGRRGPRARPDHQHHRRQRRSGGPHPPLPRR